MGSEAGKKFTWVIKNFSSLPSERVFSDQFVIGGCKWSITAFPKGDGVDYLSVFLAVANYESLPSGWMRRAKFSFTIVNQFSRKLSLRADAQHLFEQKDPDWGFPEMLPLDILHATENGFLRNEEVKIVAKVDVLEVIGELDVPKESEVTIQPLKRIKQEAGAETGYLLIETSLGKESMNVYGFQVLPSKAEAVKRIFERHPDIALDFRAKNQHLRTACMNVLLKLIDTMCQSQQELSNDDLVEADIALAYVKDSGFKVDWLEQKLEKVKENKNEEHTSEIRMQELEQELKEFKQKFLDIEALLEKEKEKVLSARAPPLTFDDIVWLLRLCLMCFSIV